MYLKTRYLRKIARFRSLAAMSGLVFPLHMLSSLCDSKLHGGIVYWRAGHMRGRTRKHFGTIATFLNMHLTNPPPFPWLLLWVFRLMCLLRHNFGFRQAIALHSQVITEYCRWVGAPQKVRGLLIRKAKKNGDDLGFLW